MYDQEISSKPTRKIGANILQRSKVKKLYFHTYPTIKLEYLRLFKTQGQNWKFCPILVVIFTNGANILQRFKMET